MAKRGEWTGGRTNGRTDGRKISPFYRTLSPIGAAAQKREQKYIENKRKRKKEEYGKGKGERGRMEGKKEGGKNGSSETST